MSNSQYNFYLCVLVVELVDTLFSGDSWDMPVRVRTSSRTPKNEREERVMFCKNCGKEIDDQAVVCPHCGVQQKELTTNDDTGSIGWGILGCCIPIVGLVLWLVWKDTKPKNAKSAGIGALISVGFTMLWYVFIVMLGFGITTL